MSYGDTSTGPLVAMVFGCMCAAAMLIFNVVMFILELLKPDVETPKTPGPGSNTTPQPDSPEPPITLPSYDVPLHLRPDRFLDDTPGVDERKFEKTNFLKLYNKTQKRPSLTEVTQALKQLPHMYAGHPLLEVITNDYSGDGIIKAYSSDNIIGSIKFYKFLNQELRSDRKQTLIHLMPFIRRATHEINNHPTYEPKTVYCGKELNRKQCAFFTEDKEFRFPGFTSASGNRDKAEEFGNTLFEIRIPMNCYHVRCIKDISVYKHEDEWLFSPYSRFRVLNKIDKRIFLEALENHVW